MKGIKCNGLGFCIFWFFLGFFWFLVGFSLPKGPNNTSLGGANWGGF